MIIEQLNPHSCKTYLIREDESKKIILVDPVIDHVKDYLQLIEKEHYELSYVIDTHTHADHISGSATLMDHTDCAYVMHEFATAQCAGKRVKEGDVVKLGGLTIKIIETPGHTKDAISLIVEDNILTGDALFLDDGGAGRDDLPGGDPGQHWESLQKFIGLPEDLTVFPAHDYKERKPSTLKHQKESNPHLQHHSREDFVQYLEDLKLGPADWMKDVLKANYSCARDPKAAWIPIDTPACEIKGTVGQGVNEQQVSGITAKELKEKIDTDQSLLLLDVREPNELDDELGHIDKIKNIPIGDLTRSLDELSRYKDSPITTVCRSGHRAHTAAQILQQAGFSQVSVLEGGMMGWVSGGKVPAK